jgi:hypothetical protein
VRFVNRQLRIVKVEYDNGDIYDEDFPGDQLDDFQLISFQEYRKQKAGARKEGGGAGGGRWPAEGGDDSDDDRYGKKRRKQLEQEQREQQ